MAINDDTHHHEAHGDASLTGGVLHDWIYCEVLEWEEKGKEVRTIPQAIAHEHQCASVASRKFRILSLEEV